MGLIAGGGALPGEAIRLLEAAGEDVFVVGFDGISAPGLGSVSPAFVSLEFGQLEALLDRLERARCRDLLLVGKFEASLLTAPATAPETAPPPGPAPIRLDALALEWLASSGDRSDDGLMALLAAGLADRGLNLLDQRQLLRPLLLGAGQSTQQAASENALADLEAARGLARSGTWPSKAQSLLMKGGDLVASEDALGTDSLIRQAGAQAGPGATVVKASRVHQDLRFDLPAIGLGTIEAMAEVSASTLFVEAETTIVIGREACLAEADRLGIAIEGVSFERPAAEGRDGPVPVGERRTSPPVGADS